MVNIYQSDIMPADRIKPARRDLKLEEEERKKMGKRFARLRRSHPDDLTQEDVAMRVGVSRGMIARLEAGEREPSLGLLRRLARIFGKKEIADAFFDDDE